MSGVVLMVSIPTENHEKHLLKKVKRKTNSEINCNMLSTDYKSGHFVVDFDKGTGKSDGIEEEEVEYQSMEKIIRTVIKDLEIVDVTWRKSEDANHYQIMFSIEAGDKCEHILDTLRENDIGLKLNSKVCVMACTLQYHNNEVNENDDDLEDEYHSINEKKCSGWNLFVSSVKSRLTVAQVVENVKGKAALTFDFIALLIISTTLCSFGLVENDNIIMLSSMLISPMMGPVLAGMFGLIIRDKHLRKTGVKNELIGLGIATLVGFFYGSVICVFNDKYGKTDWPTHEMSYRGGFRSLWSGAVVALLSGAAAALGVLSDNVASLVGVAVSTSLMPPAANAGLLWSMSFVYYIKNNGAAIFPSITQTNYFSTNNAVELATLGATSFCLTFVNIICIFAAGLIVLKIKEVAPGTTRDNARKKFWKHDIKVARDYNKSIQSDDYNAYQSILNQITVTTQKPTDFQRYSADFSKGTSKMDFARQQHTWSPSFNDVKSKLDELTRARGGARRMMDFLPMGLQNRSKRQYRRLSQIFPKKEDNLKPVLEKPNERTPLLKEPVAESKESTFVLSSGRKIIITPCDISVDMVV